MRWVLSQALTRDDQNNQYQRVNIAPLLDYARLQSINTAMVQSKNCNQQNVIKINNERNINGRLKFS
jgi:hypothetical protein